MKIAICDDELIFREDIKKICMEYLYERKLYSEILEFNSGKQLLTQLDEINILLLDIEMDGMDGIAIKNLISSKRKDIKIIFLSNHKELMQEAFGRQVYSFLTKPVVKTKFYKSMDMIMNEIEEEFIVEIDKEDMIKGKNIIYIKAEDKYTIVKTMDKEYLVRRSLNEWEQLLTERNFFRIHKSFLINLIHVKRIQEVIIMDNGLRVNISRKNVKEFKETYYNYVKRKANF